MVRQDVDDLPVNEAGVWTIEKHQVLHDYVTASHGARRHFEGNTSYIDLFSGPARTWLKEAGPIVNGSPLVAYEAAEKSGDPFGKFFLADINEEHLLAASKRLAARGVVPQMFVGPAEETVHKVCAVLNPRGLHFAFLDPYNLTQLPFSVLRALSKFQHMDMLVHVSVMHWKRELPKWIVNNAPCVLDTFMPGWREKVDVNRPQNVIRVQLFDYWCELIRGLNMVPSENVRAIDNSKEVDIYWLVLVSRHKLADKLWGSVAQPRSQGSLL